MKLPKRPSRRDATQLMWAIVGTSVVAGIVTLLAFWVPLRAVQERQTTDQFLHTQSAALSANVERAVARASRELGSMVDHPDADTDVLTEVRQAADATTSFIREHSDTGTLDIDADPTTQLASSVDMVVGVHRGVMEWRAEQAQLSGAFHTAAEDCVARLESLKSLLGSIRGKARLARLKEVGKLGSLPEDQAAVAARELIGRVDTVAALVPLEREIHELLVLVERIRSAQSSEQVADLRSNSLAAAVQRAVLEGHRCETLIGADAGFDHTLVEQVADLLMTLPDLRAKVIDSNAKAPHLRSLAEVALRAMSDSRLALQRASESSRRLAMNQVADDLSKVLHIAGSVTIASMLIMLALGHLVSRAIRRQALIVETKTAELQFQAMAIEVARDEAQAADKAKSDFLANMSHEIRTPMNAILGFSDLLADRSLGEDERQSHVSTIRRNGAHLLNIIKDILDISKIEAGQMALEAGECNPVELIRDVEALMHERAAAKHLAIEVCFEAPVPSMVRTDPTRLRQVLVNLIGNAVKFTEQGKITVRVSSLAGAQEHTVLKVAVTDTGIGMNEEQMARLFRPFSQADSTMSRRFGGTGLGLSISQRLCQLMGGTIEVQSSPGQGSTFIATIDGGVLPASVMLTAAEQFEPAPAAPLPMVQPQSVIVPRASGCKGRILYAEDGPDNQRLISFYLKKAGFELEIANNGKEALEHVEQARARGELFDLILMDMQMPEMSGYEATAELRRQGWAGPIMSLTAHAMVGDQEKCAAAGCDHHMTKPVNREALVELCTKLCGASAQRLAA